jgi:uncharacterized protein
MSQPPYPNYPSHAYYSPPPAYPPPGYFPYPPYPPPYYDTRPRLDRLLDRMRAHDPAPWGWRPVAVPCVAMVALIVFATVVQHLVTPSGFGTALALTIALNLALYSGLIAAIYYAGRDLARRYAGWGWTFGLQWPRWMDGAWAAAGVGMVFIGRIAVVLVADALSNGTAGSQSQNLTVHSHAAAVYAVLFVVAVLLAPFCEELTFRGLLLRTIMRKYGFWPAALASSAVFALFHTYEVGTFTGAATLAGVVFTLGLTNCLLARWSGRLAAGMIVHALFNALALVVLIARG